MEQFRQVSPKKTKNTPNHYMIKRATVFHFGGNGLDSSRSGKRKRLESERLKIKLDLYNSS